MLMKSSALLSAAVVILSLAVVSFSGNSATAADAAKVVAKGLDNPSGVAVHAKTGHVFIASHNGVHRFDPKSGKLTQEITGYPTDVYGKGPKYNIGPLGLAFLGDDHLVVGGGSRIDSEELVHIYKISATAPAKPMMEADAAYTLGPIPASDQTAKGEGNFYGVAASEDAIFVTCNGDDTKGWVAKADVKNGKPGKLMLSIATKVATNVDAPVPVTFNLNGKALVIGQMGEVNVPGDSLITIYNPKTGKLRKSLKTGLNDIAGVAYSPTSKKLYVTDFSWVDATKGALYQLTNMKSDAAKAKKIVDLDKPAGIAFDADGNLYVTVFGTAAEGSDKPAGALLKISASDL